MDIILLGWNHNSAPLEVRERLAAALASREESLKALCAIDGVTESLLMSTCNRIEICAVTADQTGFTEKAIEVLAGRTGVDGGRISSFSYVYTLPKSVAHVFEVASGLDSMVIGEPEILGQVKAAYRDAQEAGAVGKILSGTFQRVFSTAKRVRTETAIGRNPVSFPSLAMRLAEKVLGELNEKDVLLIGAGKMGGLTAKTVLTQGVRSLCVCTRNTQRAERIAAEFGAGILPFGEKEQALGEVDLVISSTNAPHPVLTRDVLAGVMRHRHGRPLMIVDLAVPRDVEPEAAQLDDLYLYDLDTLGSLVEEHAGSRREEIPRCHDIISEEVAKFLGWRESLQADSVIRELDDCWNNIKQEELERSLGKLEHLSPEDRNQVELLVNRLLNRLKHSPMSALKQPSTFDATECPTERIRRLLGLSDRSK